MSYSFLFLGGITTSLGTRRTPLRPAPLSAPTLGGAASGFLASTFQRLRRLRGEKPVTLRNAIAKWMGISHLDMNVYGKAVWGLCSKQSLHIHYEIFLDGFQISCCSLFVQIYWLLRRPHARLMSATRALGQLLYLGVFPPVQNKKRLIHRISQRSRVNNPHKYHQISIHVKLCKKEGSKPIYI